MFYVIRHAVMYKSVSLGPPLQYQTRQKLVLAKRYGSTVDTSIVGFIQS
uniref:Uncharacterized protein n=1 Tax=Rhizophora mucronata TaxID=61149 RepID=A0A2P2PQA0_RHIMU